MMIAWRLMNGSLTAYAELHAYWHICTGLGAYYLIVWGEFLRICLDRRQDEYVLVWPRYLSFPHVDLVTKLRNGEAKVAVPLAKQSNGAVTANGAAMAEKKTL